QILELLNELKAKLGMAIMLITHDMGVIAETAQRVAVMYGAQIVEEAAVGELFKEPLHPYTQGLLRSIPRIDLAATQRQKLEAIPGTVPTLRGDINPGCRFAPRCALAKPMHFEDGPLDSPAHRADVRRGLVRSAKRHDARQALAARAPERDADHLSGPVRIAQSADDGGLDHRRGTRDPQARRDAEAAGRARRPAP